MQYCNLLGVFFDLHPKRMLNFWTCTIASLKTVQYYIFGMHFLAFTPKECLIFELAHHKSRNHVIL
jgi:hypothetical protein